MQHRASIISIMARPKQITDDQIVSLKQQGRNNTEIARLLGINRATVIRRLRDMKQAATSTVILTGGMKSHLDETYLDPMSSMEEIYDKAHELFDRATSDKQLYASMKEIREQIKLWLDIQERVFDTRNVMEFQQTVMEVMDETDPALRREFVERLNKKRVLRGAALI